MKGSYFLGNPAATAEHSEHRAVDRATGLVILGLE
jgi:hypothetical protein